MPVLIDVCPAGGGTLVEERVDMVSTTDIPPLPRPQVTAYRVSVCRCTSCGTRVRGQHPDVAPDQYGATAHRLGDRVMAAAHAVHDAVGRPVRKAPVVWQALTGVRLTQGAITQDAMRRVRGPVGEVYAQWRTGVQEQPVVHTDDTGWRVGGATASLMAFATDEATVYPIRPQHRHEEVQEVIPADDAGVMVTDRGRRYDAHAFDEVSQQKCLAHILRSIKDVLETKKGRACDFGSRLQGLRQDARQVWHAARVGAEGHIDAETQRLQDAITSHLRPRLLTDADNQRLLNAIGRHHDRGNLLRCLATPHVEPTHNRAERAWRPAVIARKVSPCSKNAPGAQAFAAFTSVGQTLVKNGVASMVEGLYDIFQSASVHGSSP